MLNLLDRDLKSAIINVKRTKTIHFLTIKKESMRTTSQQKQNKEIEIIKIRTKWNSKVEKYNNWNVKIH